MLMYRFDFDLTAQAAGVIVKASGGRIGRLRLLKLLYLADRESLREVGSPISRGPFYAMEHGPVHSTLYDLIKGADRPDQERWSSYFRTAGNTVELVEDPGTARLSPYQVAKLEETVDQYRQLTNYELRDRTHALPEWKANDPGSSSNPIAIEDILVAVGREEDVAAIIEKAQEEESINALRHMLAEAV